jgi:hypothetical protein
MDIKKFYQLNEKELSAFDDDLDKPKGFIEPEEEEEDFVEEEEEDEDFDKEAMSDLIDLLDQLLERNGVEDFHISNSGMHIYFQIYFRDEEKIEYISDVLDIIQKIEKETLTQYESELELWKSKENEPVLEVSFFYEPNKKIKPLTFGSAFGEDDEYAPFY